MAKSPTQKMISKKHMARVERERQQRRILLTVTGVILGLIILVLAYGLLDQYVLKQNRTVAVVNDERITLKEFQSQVKFTRWQMIQEYQSTLSFLQFFGSDPTFAAQIQSQLEQITSNLSPENAPVLGSSVLEAMINDEVIRQEAERRGITVTDEEVERNLQEAFGFYADGTPTPAPSPSPFVTSTLNPTQLTLVGPTPEPTAAEAGTETEGETTPADDETVTEETPVVDETITEATPESEGTPASTSTPLPTATPYTLEGFQGRLGETLDALAEAGVTEDDLRKVIRMQILRQKVSEEVTADIETTEEQVWARHILVVDAAVAQVVIERLNAGEDFATLAAEFSTDTTSASNGGDLGWFGRGAMVSEFENAAFELEVGEISEPVQTNFGFHVIQVLGKEVRPLSSEALETKRNAAFQEWLDQLKSEQDIEQFDNWTNDVPTTPVITQ
jgi:peptidyl-prolyl cis-trans isomerase D